jgi:Cytochrome C biogenesis protein transmembrane region
VAVPGELSQEKRWHPRLDRFGPFAAPVAGVAFGFGWMPCIGPVLTSVLAIAASSGEADRGAMLLVAYSAGLAVPFLAAAPALDRFAGAFGLVRRHFAGITPRLGARRAADHGRDPVRRCGVAPVASDVRLGVGRPLRSPSRTRARRGGPRRGAG